MAPSVPIVPGARGTRPQPNQVASVHATLSARPRHGALAGARGRAGGRGTRACGLDACRAQRRPRAVRRRPRATSSTQWWSRYTAEKHISDEERDAAPRARPRLNDAPALEDDEQRVRAVEARHRAEDAARAPVHAREVVQAEPRVDAGERGALARVRASTSTVQPCAWKYQGGAAG